MTIVNARSTAGPTDPFKATTIERREVGPHDVLIDIAYTGVCHTDITHARRERASSTIYPLVPGHEIAGTVSAVGGEVRKFAVGDRAGIGCMVDSCRECDNCAAGLEQYCRRGHVKTYNAIGRDGRPNHGGYSEKIVVDERYAVRIPDTLPLENSASLLCAGITMYSPLRHWKAGPGRNVAIVGFGGLGHIGVAVSAALGARTTVLDLTTDKRDDALRRGADDCRSTSDPATFTGLAESFDLIISTVPGDLDWDAYLGLLTVDGTLVNLGVPKNPITVEAFSLLHNRRSIAGSLIGSIEETQEMVDFCAEHGIGAEIEVIDADGIDEAFERLAAGDVRYRFVIDISTMKGGQFRVPPANAP
ncbi:NAD(P)-dependent alcohol dehydrogenase [Streptomyces sp. NPDC059092]|uniref:NAD(P)-dependent alcohol dehydrogenase n=1 Tax=Streptomyces sp. NPDC059092 TaxID=3346725 RepID=UPI0036B7AE55